jgi:hypothetical protein
MEKNLTFFTDQQLQNYINSNSTISAKTIQLTKDLASMSFADANKRIAMIVQLKAEEIINDKNAVPTKDFLDLAKQYDVTVVPALENEISEYTPSTTIDLDDGSSRPSSLEKLSATPFATVATTTKYYNNYLQILGVTGSQLSFFSISVVYKYKILSGVYDITSLASTTNYGVPSSAPIPYEFFLGLDQNVDRVKQLAVSTSDQAYVQRGAYIYQSVTGGNTPLHAYIIDLVFRPSLSSSTQLKYSYLKAGPALLLHAYQGSWGGGY